MNKSHYFYLNAFRLLAAIFVLICHARCELFATYTELNSGSQNVMTQLFFGGIQWTSEALAIFFVLSGFLVGGPQLEKLHDAIVGETVKEDCKNQLAKFTKGRVTRIFLPLFFGILFAALVKSYGNVPFSWFDALLNLLGLQGVVASDFGGVYWTLAYEIWHYVLLAGIICIYCGGKHLLCGLILLMLSAFVFVKISVCWFFMFLLGTGFYYMKNLKFPKYFLWLGVLGILFVKLVGILSMDSHVYRFGLYCFVNSSMLHIALAMCIGLVMTMFCTAKPKGRISTMIENVGNRWSPFTYCLYITHFSVLEFYRHMFGQLRDVDAVGILIYFSMCILCLVFGYVFYWIIEYKVGTLLKQRLLDRYHSN